MSYKEIIDNVSNIEDLDNTTILKVLEKFSKTIKDFAIEQSGLNNLVNVEFIPSDNSATYTGNSVDYLGTLKLTLSDNIIVNKPCNIKFNIKGSNTIVVDVDEFGNALEIHLDNEVVNNIEKRELLYWHDGSNVIDITDSVLSELQDYCKLFNNDVNKIYKCYKSPDNNPNFYNLVGPIGSSSYIFIYIRLYSKGIADSTITWCPYRVYEVLAMSSQQVIARKYLTANNNSVFSQSEWVNM